MEPNLSVPIAYLTHFNSTSGFPQGLLVNTLFILNSNAEKQKVDSQLVNALTMKFYTVSFKAFNDVP